MRICATDCICNQHQQSALYDALIIMKVNSKHRKRDIHTHTIIEIEVHDWLFVRSHVKFEDFIAIDERKIFEA